MEDDWDLYAVVRSCSSSAAATTATNNTNSPTTTSSSSSFTAGAATSSCSTDVFSLSRFQTEQENDQFLYFPDLHEPRSDNNIEELHGLFKPFRPKIQPISSQITIPSSPISPLSVLQDLSQPSMQQEKQKQILIGSTSTTFAAAAGTATTRNNPHNPRSKRRKNQMKKVCQVPSEGLSTDMWSWRKYGQKPIKGSPYPRGYYRCSTSKGCLARKQVERNRSDPNMFIVTYTAEHNHPIPTHRNSLAGSTRQKPATSETVTHGDTNKPTCSTPISPATSLSPETEKIEVEEEDDEFGVSDMALSDDFFMGLEEITSPITGDVLSDHFPFTWSANNATTTAASGV